MGTFRFWRYRRALSREPMIVDPTGMESAASLHEPSLALFDQFSRYASSAEALAASLGGGSPSVLDVGSGEARLLGQFLPQARVTYLDPLLEGQPGADVLPGTVAQLRDSGQSWDWTLAVDTLEHVPPDQRTDFLDIMIARSREGVVVAAPWREEPAAEAVDARVNATFRSKTGKDYSWLAEHSSFGLPSLQTTLDQLQAAGLQTLVLGNGHAPWLSQLLALFVCYLDEPEHVQVFREISCLFNQRLYRYDHLEPVYRRIIVACRGRLPTPPERVADDAETQQRAAQLWDEFWHESMAMLSGHADRLVARAQSAEQSLVGATRQIAEFEKGRDEQQERSESLQRRCAELSATVSSQTGRLGEVQQALGTTQQQIADMEGSISWRLTAVLRLLARPLRRR